MQSESQMSAGHNSTIGEVVDIPTVLIIKDGEEVNRAVGLWPEREYVTLLDEFVD